MRSILMCVLGALVLTSGRAEAQQPRGYVMGLGGVTFGTETAGAFGGEAGGWVGRNWVVFGEAGHMLNVAPREVQDELDAAEETLEELTGFDWSFESKVAATYFGGGVKYMFASHAAMNFYVAGSAGFGRWKGEIREQNLGDLIDDLVNLGFVDEDDVEGTEFYFLAGGGLMGSIGRRGVYDVGYRFMKISDINISRVMAGAGFSF